MSERPQVRGNTPYCPGCGTADHVVCGECGELWSQDVCLDPGMYCMACQRNFDWFQAPEVLGFEDEVDWESEDWEAQLLERLHATGAIPDAAPVDDIMVEDLKRGNPRGGKQPRDLPQGRKPTKAPTKKKQQRSGKQYGGYAGGGWDWSPCTHYMSPVTFTSPFGEKVTFYATAKRTITRRRPEEMPDFGLYFDGLWATSSPSRNEFINWPDFGVPAVPEVAVTQLVDAFIRACEGERVEMGCLGAHGRTGTALACMGVLAGLTPREAIAHVRKVHCSKAVETKAQEEWVEWFHDYLFVERRGAQ